MFAVLFPLKIVEFYEQISRQVKYYRLAYYNRHMIDIETGKMNVTDGQIQGGNLPRRPASSGIAVGGDDTCVRLWVAILYRYCGAACTFSLFLLAVLSTGMAWSQEVRDLEGAWAGHSRTTANSTKLLSRSV